MARPCPSRSEHDQRGSGLGDPEPQGPPAEPPELSGLWEEWSDFWAPHSKGQR